MEETTKELVKGISDKVDTMVSKSEIETLKGDFNGEITKVNDSIADLGGKIEEIKESAKPNVSMKQDFKNKLNEFISENYKEIESISQKGHGFVTFDYEPTQKAVGSITTGSGTLDTPPSTVGTDLAPLQRVNYRRMNITSLTTNINTTSAAYPYTEAEPKDGAPAFTAEGGTYPQIDLKWNTKFAQPVKITAYERLTDESVQDIATLQNVASVFLKDKHDLKKEKSLLTGTGTNNEPKGATVYGSSFDATGFEKVDNADFRDLLIACKRRISLTHNFEDELPAIANVAVINPLDFYNYIENQKDGFNRPLYGDVAIDGTITLGGVTVIPEETIPLGKVLVCDMSKYNTTNYQGYQVKIGYVNDDLIKGQFVMAATSRFHAFVKNHDEIAFIYDDIKTILTALNA